MSQDRLISIIIFLLYKLTTGSFLKTFLKSKIFQHWNQSTERKDFNNFVAKL